MPNIADCVISFLILYARPFQSNKQKYKFSFPFFKFNSIYLDRPFPRLTFFKTI